MIYTVILLYPDYLANQYGETYATSVEAACPKDAVAAARDEAADNAAESVQCDSHDPEDWACIACIAGKHELLSEDDPAPGGSGLPATA